MPDKNAKKATAHDARHPRHPPPDVISVTRLERALYVVAVLLEDGCRLYLPLFAVLEEALETARAGEATNDRARRVIEETRARFTPDADTRSGRTGRSRAANRGGPEERQAR